MLCLGRREGESIAIGSNVEITISRIAERKGEVDIQVSRGQEISGGLRVKLGACGTLGVDGAKVGICVRRIQRRQVGLAIAAPKEIVIVRTEVRDR